MPDDVVEHMRAAGVRGREAREAWEALHAGWTEDREALDAALAGTGLPGWQDALPTWEAGESVATRNAGKKALNALLPNVPGLIGGGADLTGNTGTEIEGATPFSVSDRKARQIHWGVREHGMGSVMNGMAAHGGVLPFGGTFFVFSDYMRPAVRLAALSGLHVIYSWTHDSVGVGEDGPTHQPIEQLAVAAGHARPAGDPPGRRQRDRQRLAPRRRARRAHRPDPQPPERARARGHRRQRRRGQGRLRAAAPPTATPTSC